MIRLLSLFSGIGAPEKALEKLKIDYELVGFSEIDKFAIESYCAIHNVSKDKNLGDITKINPKQIKDFDIITWGFPCQDISIAGKMAGIENGTRSGLYYYGFNILKEKRPKISIIENVKNLTSKRFKDKFEEILDGIEELGYKNYWKVLNAKDYGTPQNRERVFIISIRNDVNLDFKFPEPIPLELKLKDILEDKVDEKYYLTEQGIGRLIKKENKLVKECNNPNVSACLIAGYYKMGYNNQYISDKVERVGGLYDTKEEKHQAGSIYNENGLSPTLTAMKNGGDKQPFVLVNEGTKKGYTEAYEGDSINYSYPNSKTKRGRVGKEISQTILTSNNMATLEKINKPICLNNSKKQPSVQDRIYDEEGISTAITASQFRPRIAERTMYNSYNDKILKDVAPTQTAHCGMTTSSAAVLISEDGNHFMRIRKLTPLECWRLMAFDDEDFYKAKNAGISDSQLYKQAGNSIVVNVLIAIFRNLL